MTRSDRPGVPGTSERLALQRVLGGGGHAPTSAGDAAGVLRLRASRETCASPFWAGGTARLSCWSGAAAT